MKARFLVLLLILVVASLSQPRVLAQQPRPPRNPQATLDRLRRERGMVTAYVDPQTGTPAYLQGDLARDARRDPLAATLDFFSRYRDAWGLGDPNLTLRLKAQTTDRLGYIGLRFEQRIANFPVLGADLRAQINPSGVLDVITGRLLPDVQLPALRPQLNRDAAVARAQRIVRGVVQGEPRLGVARVADVDHLVWEIWLYDSGQPARWQLYVDALNGTILRQIDVLNFARNRQTYVDDGSLPRTLVRSEGQGPVADQDVNAAHDNAGIVYDYYLSNFGRDSIDGNGMPIVSTVHYGYQYNNAFWDGAQMVYGDGDGSRFAHLPRALDVVAHELTHGVTEYTSNLAYTDTSGALSESFSDIFAALIDTANWDIGETVYTPNVSGDALRSLDDPTRYGQPGVWGEYIRTSADNGGVHLNSGILSRVAYEIATTIGRPKTGQIFYRTLTQKLTFSADFVVTRNAAIKACDELIGAAGITEQDCADVRMAFLRSGIGIASQRPATTTGSYKQYLPLWLEGSNAAARLAPPTIPACNTELLRNGSFENGETGWPTDAPGGNVVSGDTATSGASSAKLSNGYRLLQWTRLPNNARTLTIQLRALRATPAASNQTTLTIRTETSDGAVFSPVATMTGADPTNVWQSYSVTIDVGTIQDVRLVFENFNATHYIDDVSLVAQCG